MVVWLSNEYF